jgi:serine/threonine protein kinase
MHVSESASASVSDIFSITPLYDIDVFHILPFLTAKDIHSILQTNKFVYENYHEFKNQLDKYKKTMYRRIKHIDCQELTHVSGLLNICLDDKNKDYKLETLLEEEYFKIESIKNMEKKANKNNKEECYLIAIHKNEMTNTIIYNRYIKIINNIMVLYCKE